MSFLSLPQSRSSLRSSSSNLRIPRDSFGSVVLYRNTYESLFACEESIIVAAVAFKPA